MSSDKVPFLLIYTGQTDPFDSTSHLTKDIDGKNALYKAVSNRNGYLFVAFVVDRFGIKISTNNIP